MNLRPYQQELIQKIITSFNAGNKRICAVLGCGGGKSIIQGTIAANATHNKQRVLFIVHRKELCQQIEKTFSLCGVDFSYCTIGMVQTVCRRLAETKYPKIIMVDETHHILSNSYMKIINYYPEAIVLGFTATPIRMNEGGLGAVFQDLVEGVSTRWLIDNKFLAPYKYYGVSLVDTSKLHTKNGDYDKQEVEELMNRNYVFGSALENWRKYAENQQTIIYCPSIEISKKTVATFCEAGVAAAHLDGTTPKAERESIDKNFRNGQIKVLSNVDLFGEGYDVPDCNCCILLRPTKSLSLHIQQSMRSMRYKEGKVAIILDHVGNYTRHGLPDAVRYWSLEAKKKKEKTTITVKQCPECFSVVPMGTKVCKYCGAELVAQRNGDSSAKVIEEIMLEEISKLEYADYKKCRTFEELDLFRKAKKYKFPWTIRKCKELNIEIPKKYKYYARCLDNFGRYRR